MSLILMAPEHLCLRTLESRVCIIILWEDQIKRKEGKFYADVSIKISPPLEFGEGGQWT